MRGTGNGAVDGVEGLVLLPGLSVGGGAVDHFYPSVNTMIINHQV